MKKLKLRYEKCLTCKDRYECITKKYDKDELFLCDYKDLINQLDKLRKEAKKELVEDEGDESYKKYIEGNKKWKIKEQ